MKRRIVSILAALALCLGLLPGTAWAAEGDAGPVTITDNDGQSVTLVAGKYYVINDGDSGGGVTEQADAPAGKAYLTYADGVLTVFGSRGYVYICGKMTLSGDLKVAGDPTAQNNVNLTLTRTGDSGPTLSLNGHTLTLEKVVYFEVLSDDQPAVDGGTIRFTKLFGNSIISINSENANAVSGDLAVEKAQMVMIGGVLPVFQSLDVKECDGVGISPDSNNATELSSVIDKITIDRPISLSVYGKYVDGAEPIKIEGVMTTDGKIWAEGWGFDSGTHFIDSSVTTPTAYRVGDGWAFYTPGAEGTPAKLTLDGASYNGTINIQQADSVQLELKGENEVTKLGAAALTLTGNGSFTGIFSSETSFTNNFTGTLNAVVECPARTYTVYGDRSTSDFSARGVTCSERTPLTITNGATLTVPEDNPVTIIDLEGLKNHGTIVNEGEITISSDSLGTPNLGTIVNNGGVTIYPTVDITGEEMSAFIKGMGLSGTGTVTVEKTDAGGNKVTENYTNGGLKLLDPPGTDGKLDLSNADTEDTSNWDTQGYKWTDVKKDTDDNITSGTLTIAEGFNATSVTLPDAAVTIVTEGESCIGELAPGGGSGPQKTELTFAGPGVLTVNERINLAGGAGNAITVDEGATVEARNGIYVGVTGEDSVTVNGTLTVQREESSAISAGKVEVGNSGVLEASGKCGVELHGVATGGTLSFSNLFTVAGNGRFTADCSDYNVRVQSSGDFPEGTTAEGAISLGEDFLPLDCELKLDTTKRQINLVKTGTDEIYTGPITIHQRHTWDEAVWANDGDTHWHPCIFEGCDKRNSEAAHTPGEDYGSDNDEHWQICTVCGSETGRTPHSSAGDYGYDETSHWQECVCGRKLDSEEAHTLGEEYMFDSDEHWRICTVCSCETGRAAHIYDDSSDTECGGCGYVRTISSGGSGGSGPSTYPVNIEETEHGKISARPSRTSRGTRVTLTVTPDEGYVTSALTVTDKNGETLALTEAGGGKYTFVMPSGSVSIRAEFGRIAGGYEDCPKDSTCPIWAFTDADATAWYHDGVHYCLENGLMNGFGGGVFGPEKPVTRAQLVQILHNREGRPPVNYLTQFEDVPGGAWYAGAVRWAASEGVVSGYSSDKFGPDDNITREQLAVMLWRFAGSPEAAGGLEFTDVDAVSDYALEAMRWAAENGIIYGKTGGVLDPQGSATRAEAAAMLMRFLTK